MSNTPVENTVDFQATDLDELHDLMARVFALDLRGKMHLAGRLRRQCRRRINRMITAQPTATLYAMLGDLYVRPSDVKRAYENAIRLDPNHALARADLARIAVQEGMVSEARTHIARAVEHARPDDEWDVLDTAVYVYESLNDKDAVQQTKKRLADASKRERERLKSSDSSQAPMESLMQADPLEIEEERWEGRSSEPAPGSLVYRIREAMEGNKEHLD